MINRRVFRIVHRTKNDPHGVEGYFLHELFIKDDGTVTGWRAQIAPGRPAIPALAAHMANLVDAFRHPVLEHRKLSQPGFKLTGIDQPLISLGDISDLLMKMAITNPVPAPSA
jgi:hypothetical protein